MEINKVVSLEPQPPKEVVTYMVGEYKFSSLAAAKSHIQKHLSYNRFKNIPKKVFTDRDGDSYDWYYVSSIEDLVAIEEEMFFTIKNDIRAVEYPSWVELDITVGGTKDFAYILRFEDFKEDMILMQNFVSELESFNKEEN